MSRRVAVCYPNSLWFSSYPSICFVLTLLPVLSLYKKSILVLPSYIFIPHSDDILNSTNTCLCDTNATLNVLGTCHYLRVHH